MGRQVRAGMMSGPAGPARRQQAQPAGDRPHPPDRHTTPADTSRPTRFSRSSTASNYPKHQRSSQPLEQGETPGLFNLLRITPYWRYLRLSDMSDNRNREKQQLEIGFTGVARFVPSSSTDNDDPRARNPSQSICADSAEAGGCSWAKAIARPGWP